MPYVCNYLLLIASTGFRRDADQAGIIPASSPMTTDIIMARLMFFMVRLMPASIKALAATVSR